MSNWVDIQLHDTVTNNDNAIKSDNYENEKTRNDSENEILESFDFSDINLYHHSNTNDLQSDQCIVASTKPQTIPSSGSFASFCTNPFDFDEQLYPNKENISSMVEELLNEIHCNLRGDRNRGNSVSSDTSSYSTLEILRKPPLRKTYLRAKGITELRELSHHLADDVNRMNSMLLHHLRRRDRMSSHRNQYYDIITAALQAISPKRSVDTKMRFSIEPYPGDSGFSQWHDAMRMVARLTGGIPREFRKKLWITLAERHIQTRKVNWTMTSRFCFNEKGNPDDDALGAQIVRDLHRTGCSLFSGEDSLHNQALLKQVLLAYARWNKYVGYCQGFNMLAAIILEVMEGNVEDSLKVMIYLIEGVLPESYFANNLRGLSVDMAVFRDLLRMRLVSLAKHLDKLQYEAQDLGTGASYEPPLINVFTMQWFLTLFSNCLPKSSVLRIWDLIFLEGNEVLLRTALAIWDCLADRIMSVESADEFYSIMGVLTREMMEFGLTDTNELVKTICIMAPFPFPQLSELREKYIYNISPLTSSLALVKKGLQLFQSDDEDDVGEDQLMVATWCLNNALNTSKSKEHNGSGSRTPSPSASSSPSSTNPLGIGFGSAASASIGNTTANFLSANNIDPQRMTLDISLLKKQYAKLKERQQQAQVILTEGFQYAHSNAFSRRDPVTVNHLLHGKTALMAKRPKRPNPVLQRATRTNYDPKKGISGKSKKIVSNKTSVSMHNSQIKNYVPTTIQRSNRETCETLSWTQVKLEKKRKSYQTHKLSEPFLSICQESSIEAPNISTSIESNEQEIDFIQRNNIPVHNIHFTFNNNNNNNTNYDSDCSSSSSTELCDDEHLKDNLSDYGSSPELTRRMTIQTKELTVNDNDNGNDNSNGNCNVEILTNPMKVEETSTECANKVNISLTEPNNASDNEFRVRINNEDANNRCSIGFSNENIRIMTATGDTRESDVYSSIKREISDLTLEECIRMLNQKMSSLTDPSNNINK